MYTEIETGLYSKLTTSAGTALWGSRVYADILPDTPTYPYVRFHQMAGGELNVSASRLVDTEYLVECIGTVLSDARSGEGYIGSALHNGTLTIAGGWGNYATTQTRFFSQVETIDKVQFYRRGLMIRIRLQK